jgi:osmoprotectant transport system permease protein
VATVPLAALVAGGGLGVIINTGLATQRYGEVLAGGVLVAALTLAVDAGMGALQRRLTPPPLRATSLVPA